MSYYHDYDDDDDDYDYGDDDGWGPNIQHVEKTIIMYDGPFGWSDSMSDYEPCLVVEWHDSLEGDGLRIYDTGSHTDDNNPTFGTIDFVDDFYGMVEFLW